MALTGSPLSYRTHRVRPHTRSSKSPWPWPVKADKENRVVCPICGTTISRQSDLARHLRGMHGDEAQRRPFHCDFPGCSYTASQKVNLKVHSKTHTRDKDQQCGWSDGAGLCEFRCTDPSSLNRHKKRHVIRAIRNGGTVPLEFWKYVRRVGVADPGQVPPIEFPIVNLSRDQEKSSSNLPSALNSWTSSEPSGSRVDCGLVPDVKLEPTSPKLQNAFPHASAGASGFLGYGATIPGTSSAPDIFGQPQGKQPHYGDNWLDRLSAEFLADLTTHQCDPQLPPAPPIEDVFDPWTLRETATVSMRAVQLMPILAKAQRPLSYAEVEGVLWWVLANRDGIYCEALLQSFLSTQGR